MTQQPQVIEYKQGKRCFAVFIMERLRKLVFDIKLRIHVNFGAGLWSGAGSEHGGGSDGKVVEEEVDDEEERLCSYENTIYVVISMLF